MTRGRTESEVMGAVDEQRSEFVIADIAREDAWLSVGEGEARVLENWC